MGADTLGPGQGWVRVGTETFYYSSEIQDEILVQCEPESLTKETVI